jgi:hypothetical protein
VAAIIAPIAPRKRAESTVARRKPPDGSIGDYFGNLISTALSRPIESTNWIGSFVDYSGRYRFRPPSTTPMLSTRSGKRISKAASITSRRAIDTSKVIQDHSSFLCVASVQELGAYEPY